MTRFSLCNHKGGVGKTITTINLAGALAEMDYRVLLVDCDSRGDLSSVFLDDHESLPYSTAELFNDAGIPAADLIQASRFDGISIIPADRRLNLADRTHGFEQDAHSLSLRDAIAEVQDRFDFILFDCPPTPHLTGYAALAASDQMIVPCQPENFSLRALASTHEERNAIQAAINPGLVTKYFLSNVTLNTKGAKTDIQACRNTLVQTFGSDAVLAAEVRHYDTIRKAVNRRQPVVFYAKRSPASRAIRDLACELIGVHCNAAHYASKTAA